MENLRDTICALSTPPGHSGIAVVRLSGERSFELAGKVFVPYGHEGPAPPRTALLGRILDSLGAEIDEALVLRFPAPNSYTGEEMVEFSTHGSPVIAAALLDALCSRGARLAGPGEFTLRAFVNGKMNLAEAEAVADLIGAQTLLQAETALRQRSGELGREIGPVRDAVVDIIVELETAVEFVEEDVPAVSRRGMARRLEEARRRLGRAVDSYRRGRIVREGFTLAVVGRPNVGKRKKIKKQRAQLGRANLDVPRLPGTTRDLVSESSSMGGIPVHLQDTAGIRHSEDPVERLGIDRSVEAIGDADAVVLVADRARAPSEEDGRMRERLLGVRGAVALNKSDLPGAWKAEDTVEFARGWPVFEVSALRGAGIGELRAWIVDEMTGGVPLGREGVLVTRLRQRRQLEEAAERLGAAAESLAGGMSEEFALYDLRGGSRAWGC
jgi:tRNA modification GTPase